MSTDYLNIEEWTDKKKILVILAHPDDPEFFCGATIARWCAAGHEVHYCLLTKGQKGSQDSRITQAEIENLRIVEQKKAAQYLGVKGVRFLEHLDGELIPDLQLRNEIVRLIRLEKPQIVVTSDPQNLFPTDNKINHPDHRAAGQAVVDAIFPAVGNPRFLLGEDHPDRREPHQVEELWLTLTTQWNISINQTDLFEKKLDGILCHTSQLHENRGDLRKRLQSRFELEPETGEVVYYEKFKRIRFLI